MAASKEVRGLLGHDGLAQRADIVPPQIYHSIVRIWSRSHIADRVNPPLNVVLSNVAGPRDRIYFGPTKLEALYSVGPILEGIGLNITAWSYGDSLGVSVLGCPKSVPDPWRIIDALRDSMDELRIRDQSSRLGRSVSVGWCRSGGLPMRPIYPGVMRVNPDPFPTGLVSISHIVAGATKDEEFLVSATDEIFGTQYHAGYWIPSGTTKSKVTLAGHWCSLAPS